jgi:hypothetical protein
MVRVKVAAAAVATVALTAGLATQARAELIVGTTFQNFLISWDSATPGTVLTGVGIQGMATNENVLGLDFRPTTNQLYALGSFGNLYTINTTSGQATRVNAVPFIPSLNGSAFGVGFIPTTDELRVMSNADQNLRINPTTGVVTVDSPISPATGDEGVGINPNVVHVAYSNEFPGAPNTTFYGVDTGRDRLVTSTNANGGSMTTVGTLGFNATEMGGFDISPTSNTAFAAFLSADQSRTTFGTVNLTNGQFTAIGEVGGGAFLTGMTVVPTPAAFALLGLGMLAIGRKR